jgi:hypothetical protein
MSSNVSDSIMPPASANSLPGNGSSTSPPPRYAQLYTPSSHRPYTADLLSITHKLSAHLKADLDVSQTRHAPPDNGVSGRTIAVSVEVSAKPCELQ